MPIPDALSTPLSNSPHAGLDRPLVVNVSQFVTLDKSVFRERLGALAPDQLRQVELGLRGVLNP